MAACPPAFKAVKMYLARAEELDAIQALKSEALAGMIMKRIPEEYKSKFVHSPRLDVLAGLNAFTFTQRGNFPASTLNSWLGWRYGVYEQSLSRQASSMTASYSTLVTVPGSSGVSVEQQLLDRIDQWVSNVRLSEVPQVFGIAYVNLYGYKGRTSGIAMVTADRPIEVTGFERVTTKGQTVKITGDAFGYIKNPKIFIDKENSTVEEHQLQIEEGSFNFEFTAPSEPGEYFVEISFEKQDGWRSSYFHAPFYVESPLPMSPSEEIKNPAPNPATAEEMRAYALTEYNAIRIQNNIEGLENTKIYNAISDRYSPRGGDSSGSGISDLLGESGMPTKDLLQYKGEFEYLSESVWDKLLSPSFKQSLLNPDHTEIGFGFHQADDGIGYLTVIGNQVGELDPKHEKEVLLKQINVLRAEQDMTSVQRDEGFDQAVQQYAEDVCSGRTYSSNQNSLWGYIRENSPYMKQLSSVRYSTGHLGADEVQGDYVYTNRSHMSIGVCQGAFDGWPKKEFVVIVSGDMVP